MRFGRWLGFLALRRDVVVERQQAQALGLVAIALFRREDEQHERASDEQQAAEQQRGHDGHRSLLRARAKRVLVCDTSSAELAGMSTAHSTGVIRSAKQRTSVVAL